MKENAETPLGRFLIFFPVPQRAIFLLIAGLWLWSWQLSILSKRGIDVSKLIITNDPYAIRPRTSSMSLIASIRGSNAKITKILIPWQIATSFLLQMVVNNPYGVPAWLVCLVNISPLCQLVTVATILLSSSPMLARCVKNILRFGNIEPKPLRLNYILLSDTLTSYNKPMIDFGLYLCHLLIDPVNYNCIVSKSSLGIALNLDIMIGIAPAVIRFVQCLREWNRSSSKAQAYSSIFNALKYASNLPILVCTVLARANVEKSPSNNIFWFMFFHSAYSFWWDLTMDWDLGFLNFSQSGMTRNEVLRKRRYFSPFAYYICAGFDFTVRFFWLWELFAGRTVFEGEINFFFLEILEILRRWVWIFIRVEAEASEGGNPEKSQD